MREPLSVLSVASIPLLLLLNTAWVTGQGNSDVPQNFTVTLDGTILTATWDPPPGQTVTSYTLNCSVDGTVVLSLETSLVNVSLGVYMTSVSYSCTVYATTTNGDGTPTDSVSVTTGDSSVEAYLPFIPRVSDENILTSGDDFVTSSSIVTFPFGSNSYTLLYVGSNGIISFGTSYNDYSNLAFTSAFSGRYLVAPFWDDININDGGNISYEIFESGYYLDQVNAYIQRKRPTDFEGTWMMNVYYKQVRPFGGDTTEQNTFQAILVTDETYSYTIFIYKCGLMEWDNGATIGYTANGNPFDQHDTSSRAIACLNSPDSNWNNVIYRLSEATPEDQQPMDVSSDFTTDSATISWRVESITSTQEYVVNYGTSEDSLNLTSATVQSVSDISAINQTYEVDLTGLSPDTTYYYQVVTTFLHFTLKTDTASFTTLGLAPSGAPGNFDTSLDGTVLTFTWDPLDEDEQNGDILFYSLSCSIDDELQFELNLTDIQEISVGVYERDATYTCKISASNSHGEGPTSSQTVTTGDSSTAAYLPFIPLGELYDNSNEIFLTTADEVSSNVISIPVDFPFADTMQTRVYVGSNGIIAFGTPSYNPHINIVLSGTLTRYVIAPYWDDIDTTSGGTISYETFESGFYLEQVSEFLRRKLPTNFEGTWMMVAYYDKVAPLSGSGENTFQAIIVTDETYTYTIFTYKCGLLEWDNGVTIGYSAAGDPYENHDPSSDDVACENSPDSDWNNVVYLLSEDNPQVTIDDVSASDVGSTTTEVSWVVSYIPEQLEFTVYFGTDEDSLNSTSNTVTSSDNTTLTDQEYSVTLTKLSAATTYYFKVVATYSGFTIESNVEEFTTNELAPSGAPVTFTASLNGTVVLLTWKPPVEDERNGVIVSYFLSCSINDNLAFELNMTVIEQIYLGVYKHESDYSCELYAATLIGGGPTATVSFRTGAYSTPAYLPFIPLEILYENSNAVNLTVADDVATSAITLPTRFPFADINQTRAYVGSNGIISFGSSAYNPYINTQLPGSSSLYFIAPFWDDINIGGGGIIRYEIFESGYFLEKVNDFIKRNKPTSFEGTWMLVASYEKVWPFGGTEENTFQAIIVSDGDYSYGIFTYMCGLMDWDNGATIGYSAGGDSYDTNDPSSNNVACVNSPDSDWSNVIYQLSEGSPEDPPAEDVTISDITSDSAEVSWTVSFISSPQEYIVEYGQDEDNLNETSEKLSVSDTSLTNQTYSVTLSGLTQGILYYVRVKTTNAGNVTFYSEIESFRTTQSAPTGAPRNFVVSVEKTTLTFEWDLPADGERGGTLISYTLTCTNDDNSDYEFEVNLNLIEKITVDEFLPSTTYTCTILASTNGGDGPTASVSATTDNSTDIYLQFLDLDAILDVDETVLPAADDATAGPLSIDTGFPFGDSNQTSFFVGTNGIISFGSSSYNSPSNSIFPVTGRYAIAPYWDDIDARYGNSRISYEIHNSGFYLDQVNTFITRQQPSGFKGTWMAVIFYDRVRPYPAASNTEENSFQVILITDGTYSYSVFTYNCELMEWDNGVTIGFNGGGDFYDNHDPSSSDIACLNLPDSNWTNVVYLLNSESPELRPPNDIEISRLRTTSVTISWNIPSLAETEEYIVQYGLEEDSLNMTSSTVDSDADTSLVNQTYSVGISDLEIETIYYMRILAQYGIDNLYKRYSDVFVLRTLEEEQIAYLPFLNYTNTYVSSGVLDVCDDCTSENITLPVDFPFGQYIHQNAFIGTDGWIAFGRSVQDSEPELFPSTSADIFWTYLIAPFWGNLSTVEGGIVAWEIHNDSLSPDLFDQVNAFIANEYGDSYFNGTWMLIGFWEDVTSSDGNSLNNTFQAILVTNSTKSYAIFTYKCGELDFSDTAVIGYNIPLGDYENHPLSDADVPADTIACVHLDSVWNNVVYDLQPDGSTVFTGTPEPLQFIGSCIASGYTECCTDNDCAGTPDDCFCDTLCYDLNDCCYDIDIICPNSTAEEYDVLVANGAYIHQVYYEGDDAITLSSDLFERVTGIDYIYNSSVMFWSDTTQDKIYRANFNGSNVEELVNSSILAVDDIAVDWISNKLYWVDAVWARIEVLDLESYYRAEVLRIGPNTLPRAIAVDPESRFMFWSDWADDAKIERSFMDGSDRRTIISTSLSQPNGITIDYMSEKIYWSDSDLDKIEYSNYDGTSRTTLETAASGLKYPFSLTVANNLLFWSDWDTNKLYVTHKVHGSDSDEGYFATVALFSSSPYGIEALLSSRQQTADDPCVGNNCSHICLPNDLEEGFSCACAEGYGIESDGLSCKKIDDSELPPTEGSCLEAGYNSSDTCCSSGHCSGIPAVCSCDLECYERGDCCSDIGDSCTEGIPVIATDVTTEVVTVVSANISWTISSVAITQERYTVNYGMNMSDLYLSSESLDSQGQTLTDQIYSVVLENLQGATTYYYQIVAENDFSSSSSDVYSFTTLEGVPTEPPINFAVEVNMTTLVCSWAPPTEDAQNGDITSYTLFCLVDDEIVFNENLSSSLETFSIDLYSPNTTYNCSIYASTDMGDGPISDYIIVTTTDDVNFLMVLPFISIEDTYNFEVVTLAESDDGGSGVISIPESIGFPFGNTSHTSIYVGTNGLISFESFYNSFSNSEFPGDVSNRYLLAPFWGDVDIRQGNGEISYEIHDSGYYVDHVSGYIRAVSPSEFQGTWMIVAYWDAVHPYLGSSNPEENTFQAVLITDGSYSYSVFTYKCGLMEWDNGATIGFNSADGRYANNDPSSSDVACENSPDSEWSNVIYRLSDDSPEYPSPDNVEVSEITEESAVVSWSVEYVIEQQEYYLVYGVDEDALNLTSYSILGDSNTSLTDQIYNITLTGLTTGTDYYVFVIAEYGFTELYSDTISFTTHDLVPMGAPLNYKVVPRGTGLYFRWDAPAGSVEILSYTITCYISSELAISITLNPVNSVILDEFMPSTTYTCSIYSSSSGGDGPSTSSVDVTTEDDTSDVYLPFLSLDAIYGADQVFLDRDDDGTSEAIDAGRTDGFPFGESVQTQLYVGTNGLLSFGSSYNAFSNENFPGSSTISSLYLVAPFWDDIDISSDQMGQISYEIHQSGYYLDQVNDFLMRKRPSSFNGTWMFVAYWDSVRPFPGSSNTAVNSFQAILITDGIYSYAIFTYDCNVTEWGSSVTIGYSAAGDPYDNHDPSSSDIACLNSPYSDITNVIYLLSDDSPEVPPPDVTYWDVELTSVNISLTVPYILEEEEYYLIYGFDSDELDMTSDSIQSVSDTSLENQTYSLYVEGLESGAVYYAQVVAAFGTSGEFRRYSDTFVFRTKEDEQAVYLEFLPHTDTSIDSATVRLCDDCTSFRIPLPDVFPFGGYFHDFAYVSTNGLVSFGRPFNGRSPEIFPSSTSDLFWRYIAAAFWADWDTVTGGSVSWEIHNSTESRDLLERVDHLIQIEYGDANFTGSWMLVSFWENVTETGSPFQNTFQEILITNGTKSYAVYTYKCGELEWSSDATIGANAPPEDYYNHPLTLTDMSPDEIACVHLDSVWNNVILDLEPNPVILPMTPAPSSFIGSCAAAGFTECCITGCSGLPSDCMCDDFCRQLGDCCYDIDDTCPEGNTTDFDIVVANGFYIHRVHYQGNSSDTFTTNSSGTAVGIDFHYEESTLFWSDVENDVIYQLQLNESEEVVLVDKNINVVDDIAVDWTSNKLYWVDAAWARIEVLDLESLYRAEVLRVGANTNPRAIAVEPHTRFMFWTDWGETPKIEQAFMDGSGRRTIVDFDLSQPNSVTVDYASEKIYWADSDLDKIEYSNYDGSERRSVETEETGLLYPFGLTVARDILFWSDWGTNTIYATHKVHGADTSEGYFTEIAVFTSIPYGIEALNADRQSPANNTCDGNGCSHICLMSDVGYTCVCPYGYSLESDQMECKADNTTGSGGAPLEGSCIDAGYNESCCQHGYCAGYPFTCFCDRECYSRGDCCDDIIDMCPEGDPALPTNAMVVNITGTSAVVVWTITNVAFTFEEYRVYYGSSSDSLSMASEILYGIDLDATNETYTIILSGLEPLSTYFFQVMSSNSESSTYTAIMNFTTGEDAPSGPPSNFTITIDVTSLTCLWDPPQEDLQNGEIISYTLVCSSGSEVVINLSLNPTVFEISVDLFSHSTTYSCSVAASTAVGIGPYSSAISVITEALATPLTYLPFIPLGVEYGSNTTTLPESDDETSSAILLPNTAVFPFGDSLQTQFYVGTNGLISFDTAFNSFVNQIFPGPVSFRYLVAPFWDDVDIRGGNGVISYEIYDSGYFLDHVSAFVRKQRPSTFQGTWMAVAYWDAVHPYVGATSTEENTYQAILITDGTYSYTIFTYMCGLLEWGNGATIGFNAPGGYYDNYSPSYPDIDCVNEPASIWSNVVYLLSNSSSEFDIPRDVTLSNITEDSALVSWIVSSVTENQEYYLLYGTDRSNLSLTTNRIQGNTDISIVNGTYSISLQNLEDGTVYYVVVVAEFGSTTLYSGIESFTTVEPAPDGPPLNFTVIADGISLRFSWDPPAGDQVIISFTVSCSVGGDIQFSAKFKEIYQITLDELTPSTNYSCSVYASTSGGDGPPTNEVFALTEDVTRDDVYLPFIPTNAAYGVEEIILDESDEGTSDAILIPIGFPFGNSTQNQFYVGTNGLLSFGSAYGPYSNRAFPDSIRYLVAPFWDDVDTRGGNGRISYEVHQSGYFLEQVNTYLNRKRPSDFQGTWMAVVYYDEVHPYLGTDNQEENTFQVVLITDGIYSYTIFIYKCGLMEWDNGATIGFNAAGDPYANHDPSTADVACLNMMYTNWSNVDYLLSNESPETPVPRDVAVTDITTVEAVVSWTIPRFTRPEMYYIQYGDEESVLDMTTAPVSSPTDTSLVNQTYSITLQGLSPSTTYFLRVVAVYDVISTRYSDSTSFRTYDEEQVIYLPFLNHSDTNIGSGRLDSCDNCTSVEILFPDNLPFGGYFHQSAYVGTDGLVSFGRRVANSAPELFPSTVPEIYWSYILAPFWADLDTTENGSVSWELHDIAQSPQLLDQVNVFIQTIEGVNFTGTWMLVAFWEDVDLYANTFQAIVITDGTNSYSVYTYKCGELTWPGQAIIGYNAPLMGYTNDPFSGNSADSIACTHLISPWNNIVYDLQPGSVILPTTPEPSSFIGSCIEAGYTECCEGFDCEGSPNDCYCDSICITFQDCCYDFLNICPNTTAPRPYDILVAVGPSLTTVHYQGSDSLILCTNFSENTLAVDFNYENSKVYWSHTELEYTVPATIYCANLNGSEEQVLVDTNILFVSDIAMDWIAGHLYWVDSSWARIEAMDLDNFNRTEVIQTGPNTNPSAIAVDPLRRYMFWSDLGITPQIERAFMDGGDRRAIISSEISRPLGITIDYSEQRIYWSDVDLYRIEYCDYNGLNRFVVETEASGLFYPFALTVANDLLFWTDWVTDSLYATHKEHGSDDDNGYFQTVATFSSDPYGIEALLENRQEPGQNPCENSTCSHICLLSGTDDRGFICVCPEGYQLEPDRFTCKVLNDSGITPPTEGLCAAAGYTLCCTHGYCAGYPPTCSCHPDCTLGTFGCCSDFEEICPAVPPLQPADMTTTNIYATSAQIDWTVRRTPFGFETYSIEYGLTPSSLNMQSDIIAGTFDSSLQNVTYSVVIEDLQPLTTYYYRIVATNIVGVTISGVETFITQAVMTSSVMFLPESTVSSLPVPTTTIIEQPTQSITAVLSTSSPTSTTARPSSSTSAIQTGAPTYSSMQTAASTYSSMQAAASTYSSMQAAASTYSSMQMRTPTITGGVTPTVSVPTSAGSSSEGTSVPTSSSIVTSPSQTSRPSTAVSMSTSTAVSSVQQSVSATSAIIQQPSSSLLATSAMIVSSQQQTSSPVIPSLPSTSPPSQTSMSMGTTTASGEVMSSSTISTLPLPTTSSLPPTQFNTTIRSMIPTGVPIETKLPAAIEENRIKITLGDYDEKSFNASVQLSFRLATAEVVNECCAKDACQTIKLKRSTSVVESDDVIITEISDTSMGVSVIIYVLMNEDEVLDGNALLSCIQSGSDIYNKYNFDAVSAERVTGDDTGKSSEGLPGGAIAGIVIAVLLVVIAVLATAAYIFYHIRKKGLYRVTGLVGGFDEPMTDKYFEFGRNDDGSDVKENPGYEEKEL